VLHHGETTVAWASKAAVAAVGDSRYVTYLIVIVLISLF